MFAFHAYTGWSTTKRWETEQTQAPPRKLVMHWGCLNQIARIIKPGWFSTERLCRSNKSTQALEFHMRSDKSADISVHVRGPYNSKEYMFHVCLYYGQHGIYKHENITQ